MDRAVRASGVVRRAGLFGRRLRQREYVAARRERTVRTLGAGFTGGNRGGMGRRAGHRPWRWFSGRRSAGGFCRWFPYRAVAGWRLGGLASRGGGKGDWLDQRGDAGPPADRTEAFDDGDGVVGLQSPMASFASKWIDHQDLGLLGYGATCAPWAHTVGSMVAESGVGLPCAHRCRVIAPVLTSSEGVP
jgi:hypothetical protein